MFSTPAAGHWFRRRLRVQNSQYSCGRDNGACTPRSSSSGAQQQRTLVLLGARVPLIPLASILLCLRAFQVDQLYACLFKFYKKTRQVCFILQFHPAICRHFANHKHNLSTLLWPFGQRCTEVASTVILLSPHALIRELHFSRH